jgi:hypothetical protein
LAEARRRERRERRFKSSRDHHFSDPKLRQRSIRLLTGRAGRTSLRVHHFTSNKQLTINMKLTKALKYKNQLAGDLAELKDRLAIQNSRASTVPFDYDANQVLGAIRKKTKPTDPDAERQNSICKGSICMIQKERGKSFYSHSLSRKNAVTHPYFIS